MYASYDDRMKKIYRDRKEENSDEEETEIEYGAWNVKQSGWQTIKNIFRGLGMLLLILIFILVILSFVLSTLDWIIPFFEGLSDLSNALEHFGE